jgi:hypothetical protein
VQAEELNTAVAVAPADSVQVQEHQAVALVLKVHLLASNQLIIL